MATITIDPVTRIEGHLKIDVQVDGGAVTSAKVAGNLYRDFENMLVGRNAFDPVHLTQRVCGVCPVSHAIAAARAVETAVGFSPNAQARWLRNLIQGGNYLQDHILHFYHLNLVDYVEGPGMPPWSGANTTDLRITGADRDRLIGHYIQALDIRRKAQELVAILAGKVPHVATILPGGVTQSPTLTQMRAVKSLLSQVRAFVRNVYVPDAQFLAGVYSDYYGIGRGPGNLLSLGVFEQPTTASSRLLKRGRIVDRHGGALQPATGIRTIDSLKIAEHVASSYYADAAAAHPTTGVTAPQLDKAGAYSWLKSPRYDGGVYEVGPLARMTVSRAYSGGVSVMDRVIARAYEARRIADAMVVWASRVVPRARSFTRLGTIAGTGIGLTEAPRGSLGHWARFSAGIVSRYQIITPTCWNASPADTGGVAGAMEQALVGTPVDDAARPVELMRVVHSFDPCTGCAVHAIDLRSGEEHDFVTGPLGGTR